MNAEHIIEAAELLADLLFLDCVDIEHVAEIDQGQHDELAERIERLRAVTRP